MTRLSWSNPKDRQFETGLDRGVLYLNNGQVIPWNGLTAVDEDGGEGQRTYYVDGRPFLHLPTPKEFSATLRAYTYPDEFSSVMGEAKVSDGLYIDSQAMDSFGLSYRTLLGDGVKGEQAGYKIHIVYNATVTPTARSYASLGGDTSPLEFEWGIQAVPVPVEGYRATAHVIIDTRDMDPLKLQAIEDMLYGSEILDASLPDIQDVFDTLSYGDAIIIVDNDDGTWDAIGSYQNIYMIGDGIFQIDNVDAVDNGDGTYDISSTP